jgi:hypothetical protein
MTVAVGGAGAQSDRIATLLRQLGGVVARGELRLALVAGTNRRLANDFKRWLGKHDLLRFDDGRVRILCDRDFPTYYRRFNGLLGESDLLWTKPSELVFYAALGLPLILDDPVGHHEWHNQNWLLERGAGALRGDLSRVGEWLPLWLRDGRMAEAARNGYRRIRRDGCDRIAERLQSLFTEA